jgi:hypothetical protein
VRACWSLVVVSGRLVRACGLGVQVRRAFVCRGVRVSLVGACWFVDVHLLKG